MPLNKFLTTTHAGERVSILNPREPSSRNSSVFHTQPPTPAGPQIHQRQFVDPSLPSLSPAPLRRSRRYQCNECLKVFTTSSHLARHLKIHTGNKPYHCPWPGCSKSCGRHDNILQHYRIHLPKADRKRGILYIRQAYSQMRGSLVVEQLPSPAPSRMPSPGRSVSPVASFLVSPLPDRSSGPLSLTNRPLPLHLDLSAQRADVTFLSAGTAPFTPITPSFSIGQLYSTHAGSSQPYSAVSHDVNQQQEQSTAPTRSEARTSSSSAGFQVPHMGGEQR